MDTHRTVVVYGRKPVLEALADDQLEVDRLLVDRTARGGPVDAILAAARRRGVPVRRVSADKVTRVSGNGRHDQGVVAEVTAPGLAELDGWLAAGPAGAAAVLVLDGVTNPANVGMVVRAAAGAGLEGVVLPRVGSPDVGPLVVKASAGVALAAPILRCDRPADATRRLAASGFEVLGLRGGGAEVVFDAPLPDRVALVLGNETAGVSPAVAETVAGWRSIPLAGGIESLNVATAAAVVAYEVARRRAAWRGGR